jgi:hypothetical protein
LNNFAVHFTLSGAEQIMMIRGFFGATVMLVCLAVSSARAQSTEYTPDHPVVRGMIEKSVKWLGWASAGEAPASSFKMGTEAIVAYALHKAGEDYGVTDDHPLIQRALKTIEAEMSKDKLSGGEYVRMYSPAITLILLCDLDPKKYKNEINRLLDLIYSRQMIHGGWTYENLNNGDTSQVQYCCLALWIAEKKGFKVDKQVAAKALSWLVKTQTGEGGFVYHPAMGQGGIGGGGGGQQTLSLGAAGLGSVYILADLLGITGGADTAATAGKGNDLNFDAIAKLLPPTVTQAQLEGDDESDESGRVNVAGAEGAMKSGDQWFQANFSIRVPQNQHWNYYYIYAFERYASFKEKAENKNLMSPEWYNLGVEFLAETQSNEGYWSKDDEHSSNAVATALAMLFLLRSTKSSLDAAYNQGQLVGGVELKDGVDYKRRKDGKIVITQISKSVEDALALAENATDEDIERFMETLEDLKVSDDPEARAQQLIQMRTLVRTKNYLLRRLAVKFLGRQRDLEGTPLLIYALTDPDPDVQREAHDALRYVSRKFSSINMPEEPTKADMESIIEQWKTWYLSVNPEAVFIRTESTE